MPNKPTPIQLPVVISKRAGGHAKVPKGTRIIDVDRTHPILGNPYILEDHRNDAQRSDVIAQYAKKLDADLAVGGPMSKALHNIGRRVAQGERIAFRCWCAPKPCHADMLVNRLRVMLKIAKEPDAEMERDIAVGVVTGNAPEPVTYAESPRPRQRQLF